MNKLIVLTGPTGVGKTALSISLAKRLNASIISADSMQVYKYMDIGTAKIMKEEMQGVDHYLVDCLMPDDEFNVARFKDMAEEAIDEIYKEGKLPIIVGGTGFYIQALLKSVDFDDSKGESKIRAELIAFANEKGNEALFNRLKEIDPVSASRIHPNNVKRVIRAIEFYMESGMPISSHNDKEMDKESKYDYRYFVLTNERELLYKNIELRIDKMLEAGLVDEVKSIMDMGYSRDLVSQQGLGYKEIWSYLLGESSLDEAVDILKRDTRHFAKRQLTWFRREKDVIWLDKQIYKDDEALLNEILNNIKEWNM
ncbi:MAG: tRNA (adenosine(37)-N6)-dimethylallyltransferase MiaA [Lachnospiraceae bacterium]|nr:tRNA (adenosine(37)-N6)-dimethylallyltransferase MiaA [Lachnospiraceae bacterium]